MWDFEYKIGELYKLVDRTFCWPYDSIINDTNEVLDIDWGKHLPVMFLGIDFPVNDHERCYKFLYKGIPFRIMEEGLEMCIEGPWGLCCPK